MPGDTEHGYRPGPPVYERAGIVCALAMCGGLDAGPEGRYGGKGVRFLDSERRARSVIAGVVPIL